MKNFGFGLMRLPLLDPNVQEGIDIEMTKKMADTFLQNGFTYFDTAAPYHNKNSEIAFREAVAKRYPRTAYTVTDKLTMFMVDSQEELEGFFADQLERLGLDTIDYYWLHNMGEWSYRKALRIGAFAFVQKLKEEGKVKHIGFSFHDKAELLDEILTDHPEMEFVQLQINYVDWDDEIIQSGKCYEVARKHNKQIIVMEPVKGGCLAKVPQEAEELFRSIHPEASPASWAIRFAASLPNVMMVLSGMSNEAQMQDNLSFMKEFQPLSEAEMEAVKQAAKIIKNSITIPCTACRYCVEDCPKKIPIPEVFSIYNNLKRFGAIQERVAATYYKNATQNRGKASECLKCGKCEQHCPQHLTIRKYLEDVAQELE